MANRSAEFLDIDEYERVPNMHRSRSGGYADHLEEKIRWDRRDRERQMKRYHDSYLSPTDAHSSDRLYAPAFEPTHRRARSHEHFEVKEERPVRSYNLREAVPARLSNPNDELARSNEPIRRSTEKTRPRKPSIKVQIHQDDPPAPFSSRRTPSKSPSASPRSPSAVPQLQFQYTTLRHKLKQTGTTCAPYIDVEAAQPHDLTFAKISEQCKAFAFELEVWSNVANVDNMARIDSRKRRIVEAASRTLDRLIGRVTALNNDCGKVKPRDLKMELLPEVDDSQSDEDDDDRQVDIESDIVESPAYIIQAHLNSIQTQIQTLKRLSRSLQEATPGAKSEVVAVDALVAEVGKYFGSQERLDRYRLDARLAGKQALEEARYAAGTSY